MSRYAPLTAAQQAQLDKIEPSINFGLMQYPCDITTNNNVRHENTYIVNEDEYKKIWGVWPEDDKEKDYILINDVKHIESSKNRLPSRFANTIYSSGENGMGYFIFRVKFVNSQIITFLTGSAVDFISYPDGLGPNDVIAVGVGGIRDEAIHVSSKLKYKWCLHS